MNVASKLSAIGAAAAIMMALLVFFNTSAQIATLRNDVKATDAEFSVYEKVMGKMMTRMEALEHAAVASPTDAQHHNNGKALSQQQPAIELNLQTYTDDDGNLAFVEMGGDNGGAKNPTLHFKLGDVVKIVVVNADGVTHDFVIDAFGVHSERIHNKGDATTVTFKADKVGQFQYYCSVPGHKAAGMKGVIVVEAP